jgi:hypothetical protein
MQSARGVLEHVPDATSHASVVHGSPSSQSAALVHPPASAPGPASSPPGVL